MAVHWLFNTTGKTAWSPKICGQLCSISDSYLCLHNPWIADSVFMAKLYSATLISLAFYTYPNMLNTDINYNLDSAVTLTILELMTPLIIMPFLIYRIFYIKNLSNFFLNRHTKKIYYQRISRSFAYEWNNLGAGLYKRTEFSGSSFSTNYGLAFAPFRQDGTLHQKDCLWIDSNEPTDPDIKHVAEVWEYLRHFMDHGPDKLPPPGEPNWWHRPLHAICLTPAEAWRHYAPWRTGEPGEMQGKKNWQLPFWAVLFPYNFSLAVCWYLLCRTFNVRAAPAPAEAFEEAPIKPGIRKRP